MNMTHHAPTFTPTLYTITTAVLLYYASLFQLQEQEDNQTTTPPSQATEEWMLICHHNADMQLTMGTQEDIDWTLTAQSYHHLDEAPSFISQQRQAARQQIY